MRKFTRRHYNKKLIAFGLASFMGIGLTSTGFAAWVMSRDASVEPESGVNVAIIEDTAVKITLAEDSYTIGANEVMKLKDEFRFDSDYQDNEGRVRAKSGATESDSEDLKVTVSGKVEAAGVKYAITAKVELPEGVSNAIQQEYLAWKDVDYSTMQEVLVNDDGTFEFTIEFKWGEKFKGLNPCYYYDKDFAGTEGYDPSVAKLGKDISNDDMQKELTAFWNLITVKETENKDTKTPYTGSFKIIIEATPAETSSVQG